MLCPRGLTALAPIHLAWVWHPHRNEEGIEPNWAKPCEVLALISSSLCAVVGLRGFRAGLIALVSLGSIGSHSPPSLLDGILLDRPTLRMLYAAFDLVIEHPYAILGHLTTHALSHPSAFT
jgi:hypothetical protein